MALYKHYLYRWIDVYGKVMYVGETRRMLDKRIAEHMSCNRKRTNFKKKDLPLIHKVEYMVFDDDYEAMEHERYYISLWRPRLNKADKLTGVKFDDNKRTDWKTKKVYNELKTKQDLEGKKLTTVENFIFGFFTVASVIGVLLFYMKN